MNIHNIARLSLASFSLSSQESRRIMQLITLTYVEFRRVTHVVGRTDAAALFDLRFQIAQRALAWLEPKKTTEKHEIFCAIQIVHAAVENMKIRGEK